MPQRRRSSFQRERTIIDSATWRRWRWSFDGLLAGLCSRDGGGGRYRPLSPTAHRTYGSIVAATQHTHHLTPIFAELPDDHGANVLRARSGWDQRRLLGDAFRVSSRQRARARFPQIWRRRRRRPRHRRRRRRRRPTSTRTQDRNDRTWPRAPLRRIWTSLQDPSKRTTWPIISVLLKEYSFSPHYRESCAT